MENPEKRTKFDLSDDEKLKYKQKFLEEVENEIRKRPILWEKDSEDRIIINTGFEQKHIDSLGVEEYLNLMIAEDKLQHIIEQNKERIMRLVQEITQLQNETNIISNDIELSKQRRCIIREGQHNSYSASDIISCSRCSYLIERWFAGKLLQKNDPKLPLEGPNLSKYNL